MALDGGELEDLTASQRRKPLLGSGSADPVEFRAPSTGRLLVATDGLLNSAGPPEILTASRGKLDKAADALVPLVRLSGGALQDGVSAWS